MPWWCWSRSCIFSLSLTETWSLLYTIEQEGVGIRLLLVQYLLPNSFYLFFFSQNLIGLAYDATKMTLPRKGLSGIDKTEVATVWMKSIAESESTCQGILRTLYFCKYIINIIKSAMFKLLSVEVSKNIWGFICLIEQFNSQIWEHSYVLYVSLCPWPILPPALAHGFWLLSEDSIFNI